MSGAMSWAIILIIYIVSISLRAGRKKGGSSSAARPGAKPASSPGPAPSARAAAPARVWNRRAAKDDDCEYGEVNHQYSHASERRVAQLKGYLEAGLIDKKEYAQMLERYTRQDQAYGDYNNYQ